MSRSQWHKIYSAWLAAPPAQVFELIADLPSYPRWLPPSSQYAATTEVEPYPVAAGSRYRDGKPGEPGKEWWGTVTGYSPTGSLDFRHRIDVRQLRASVDVHIHYSLEPDAAGTLLNRWLILDVAMPPPLRPARALIIRAFDRENVRTLAALQDYARADPGTLGPEVSKLDQPG